MPQSKVDVKNNLNSEASKLSDVVSEKIENNLGNKATNFGIFNIIMEPISFSIDFVLFNAFGILIEYANGHFNWFLEDEKNKTSLDNSLYTIDSIDLFCKSMEGILRKQLPDKYFKAYGW